MALADDELASVRPDLIDALAHSPKSVPVLCELLSSGCCALKRDRRRMCPERPADGRKRAPRLGPQERVGPTAPVVAEGARSARRRRRCPPPTSRRESVEVLSLVAAGRRNADIAAELFLSEKTVKTHINHIFTKLGVADRVQAVLYYRASIDPGGGKDTTTG